tara:strand:+ start:871 stop:1146 length:276 start_codon:yes stop_codon:yes gene_type:complete
MSNKKLTTARYLLKQVQIRRLKLLGVGPELTSNQLAEYKMCEKAIKELEHILDGVEHVTFHPLTEPPELPNIAKFKKPKTEARLKINFKPH